jgi:serine/threonine protein kinase
MRAIQNKFRLSRGGHAVTQPAFVCGYEILAELGRGTTGTVYKARHRVLKPERTVALKVPLLGSGPDTTGRMARYQNEWNALRLLTWEPDPAIPSLYDVGCDAAGQNNYYAREFVDGSTLEHMVATGALKLREGIRVLSAIAGAVQRMHGRGIGHRNLRVSNVLMRADGTPKLIGLGHVWPLGGADGLPPGVSGVSPEVDVLALQEILSWLCATLRQPVPEPLEAVRRPGSVASPGRFAEALGSYLQVT